MQAFEMHARTLHDGRSHLLWRFCGGSLCKGDRARQYKHSVCLLLLLMLPDVAAAAAAVLCVAVLRDCYAARRG